MSLRLAWALALSVGSRPTGQGALPEPRPRQPRLGEEPRWPRPQRLVAYRVLLGGNDSPARDAGVRPGALFRSGADTVLRDQARERRGFRGGKAYPCRRRRRHDSPAGLTGVHLGPQPGRPGTQRPRGEPLCRLPLRPVVVRDRADPGVPGGRSAGPKRGTGGGCRREQRLRVCPGRPGAPDAPGLRDDHQRPGQRRPGGHCRVHVDPTALHRGFVLLLEGPHRRRSAQARPGGPGREPCSRRRSAMRRRPPTWRTAGLRCQPHTFPASLLDSCRCIGSSSAGPRRSSGS
jgi:hypothetical protein